MRWRRSEKEQVDETIGASFRGEEPMQAVRVFVFLIGAAATAAGAQTLGQGGSMASGGAGPDGQAQGASEQLERCDAPKGTLAVVEPHSQVSPNLQRYGLGSPTSVIPMLVQQ